MTLHPMQMPAIVERLAAAWNWHDVAGVAEGLHPSQVSIHPLHPERIFQGREHAVLGWKAVFGGIPNFRAELLGCAVSGDCIWSEPAWQMR